jgi:hypothetical protein
MAIIIHTGGIYIEEDENKAGGQGSSVVYKGRRNF